MSLAAAFAWAAAVILLRRCGEHLPPFTLNLAKNAIVLPLFAATLVVLALSGIAPLQAALGSLSAMDWMVVAISGVLGIAIGDTLYFRGLNAIGASRMAVAQAMYSPSVILLSTLYLDERLRLWQLVGVVLVLAGILLVTYVQRGSREDRRRLRVGAAWAMAAVFMMAAGVVLAKPVVERADFLLVVSLRILAGFLGLALIAGLRGEWRAHLAQLRAVRRWGLIVAAAIMGNYVSMLLWLGGYRYAQASIAAVLNEMAAVFILPLAAFFLREQIHGRQIVGVLLALSGVAMVLGFA